MPNLNPSSSAQAASMTESPASLDEEIESGEEDLPEDDVERLHGSAVVVNNNQTVVHTGKSEYHDLIQSLNDDGFGVCVDLCGVDYLGNDTRSLPVSVTAERFELVVNLLDVQDSRRPVSYTHLTLPTILLV